MLTLLSTALSFAMGGLPKLLDFFQDKSDKKHELQMAQIQVERELELRKAGFEVERQIEEIRTNQVSIQAASSEQQALYAHDAEIGQGASQWVINLRSSVRPVVTYIFVLLLVAVDISGVWWAWSTGLNFFQAIKTIYTEDQMQITTSIIAFWFGTRAFRK
jgi:hypothetical protein